MRKVEMWETADGVIHASQDKARKHADSRHSALLFSIAGHLYGMKRTEIATWIAENMPQFETLKTLADDCQAQTETEEGE